MIQALKSNPLQVQILLDLLNAKIGDSPLRISAISQALFLLLLQVQVVAEAVAIVLVIITS